MTSSLDPFSKLSVYTIMTISEAEARSYDHPVLFYDGICVLCNSIVLWIIRRDKEQRFLYATLQQDIGQIVNEHVAYDESEDSVILLHKGQYYTRANAAIEVARILGFPYSLLCFGKVLPQSILDLIYKYIAAHRYQWFGKDETCLHPSDDIKSRLLELEC